MPSSNVEFWQEKFERNIERDRRNQRALKKLGWRVAIIWECQCKDTDELVKLLKRILK